MLLMGARPLENSGKKIPSSIPIRRDMKIHEVIDSRSQKHFYQRSPHFSFSRKTSKNSNSRRTNQLNAVR